MAESKKVDMTGEDSDFKDYILYIAKNNPGCNALLELLIKCPVLHNRTWIQDVHQLSSRPPWLNGVPILVSKKDEQAYKGSAAMQFVKTFKDDEPLFAGGGSSVASFFGFEDGGLLSGFQAVDEVRPEQRTEAEMMEPPSGAGGVQRKGKGGGPETASAAQRMMDARTNMDKQRMDQYQQQHYGGGGGQPAYT